MPVYNCKMCGMPLDILDGMRVCTCEHCGGSQTLPRIDNAERVAAINRANQLRRNGSFERAGQMFEELIAQKDPYDLYGSEDADLIWSLVLCRYGIRYEVDPTTQKPVPVCRRPQDKNITEDEDYQRALSCADFEQKVVIMDEARCISSVWKISPGSPQKEAVSETPKTFSREDVDDILEAIRGEDVNDFPEASREENTPDALKAEAVSMASQDEVQTQKEPDPQKVRNARFALQEADNEWDWLEMGHFTAAGRDFRALAEKYESIAPSLTEVVPDTAEGAKMNALAERCSSKATYCRYLGAVSDLKKSGDSQLKEDAYHYLVSLGDYEDASLILDEYRYERTPTKKKDAWLSREEKKGLAYVILTIVGISLAVGFGLAGKVSQADSYEGSFVTAVIDVTIIMLVILGIPVVLYLSGDRIAKLVKDVFGEKRETEDDRETEEDHK